MTRHVARLVHLVAVAAASSLVIATASLVVLPPREAYAAAFDVADTTWEGGSEMLEIARAELGAARVFPVGVLNWDEVKPEDGVLAVHPLQAMDTDEAAAFMKAGGRLAILDDFGRGDETLQRFHIERIAAPTRPVSALRNKRQLPIAEPVIDVVAGHSGGPHPIVSQVSRLVTNHPTGLRHPGLSPVLKIRAIGEPDVIIAVAGQVERGRLFAMSDPSAAINQMLRYPGNRAFVAGLVRYLVDDDGTMKRRGKLFIVTNKFSEEGSFGGKTSARKEIESELKAIASALADARRDGFPAWAHIALAALAAISLAIWVARSSARPYKSPTPRYARRPPLVAQGGAAGRFAMLAAPTSPRSLALLELRSALAEALAHKLNLASEPATDDLADLAARAGPLDDATYNELKDVQALMHHVENAVVAGRAAPVSRAALAKAAAVTRAVVAACGVAQAPFSLPKQALEGPSKPPHEAPLSPPGDRAG